MCYRTEKYTVHRRVRAFFSPEILQAEAVKGLIICHGEFTCKRKQAQDPPVSLHVVVSPVE